MELHIPEDLTRQIADLHILNGLSWLCGCARVWRLSDVHQPRIADGRALSKQMCFVVTKGLWLKAGTSYSDAFWARPRRRSYLDAAARTRLW
jgi:hypothetical protein